MVITNNLTTFTWKSLIIANIMKDTVVLILNLRVSITQVVKAYSLFGLNEKVLSFLISTLLPVELTRNHSSSGRLRGVKGRNQDEPARDLAKCVDFHNTRASLTGKRTGRLNSDILPGCYYSAPCQKSCSYLLAIIS